MCVKAGLTSNDEDNDNMDTAEAESLRVAISTVE